jgi:hypothetical protein
LISRSRQKKGQKMTNHEKDDVSVVPTQEPNKIFIAKKAVIDFSKDGI